MPMSNTRTLDLGDVKAVLDAHGILRWDSNNHAVPMDCLDQVAPKGYDRAVHKAAIDKDTTAFLAAYCAKACAELKKLLLVDDFTHPVTKCVGWKINPAGCFVYKTYCEKVS